MNEKILGHELIESQLSRLIRYDRVFSACIFTGISGIGKGMMARRFAKCLLANIVPSGDSLIIPDEHPIHRMVDNCIHPDLFILEQNSISIDDIRSILQNLYKRPVLSKWRVMILDNMTFINKNVANALLKVIEEPPHNTVIIMTTAFIGALPKTLLSRLHKIFFKPLSQDIITYILQTKGFTEAEHLAAISDGSAGHAIAMNNVGGMNLYHGLYKAFTEGKASKDLIMNACLDNFAAVRNCLIHIFREYMYSKLDKPQYEPIAAEISQRIRLLNRCELLQMDKNAVILACASPIQF